MRVTNRWIPFWFLLGCGLLISKFGHAMGDVWTSTNIITGVSTTTLCGQTVIGASTVPLQGLLHAVIVSSGSTGNNTIQFYDSSWTVVSATSPLTIGPINTSSVVAPMVYDVAFRHGLSYVSVGSSVIQIVYTCF